MEILDASTDLARFSGPGSGYNDADMLEGEALHNAPRVLLQEGGIYPTGPGWQRGVAPSWIGTNLLQVLVLRHGMPARPRQVASPPLGGNQERAHFRAGPACTTPPAGPLAVSPMRCH